MEKRSVDIDELERVLTEYRQRISNLETRVWALLWMFGIGFVFLALMGLFG